MCIILFESMHYCFDNMQVLIFCALVFKMPIVPLLGCFFLGGWGKSETFCSFIPLGMQYSGLAFYESNSVKIGSPV